MTQPLEGLSPIKWKRVQAFTDDPNLFFYQSTNLIIGEYTCSLVNGRWGLWEEGRYHGSFPTLAKAKDKAQELLNLANLEA